MISLSVLASLLACFAISTARAFVEQQPILDNDESSPLNAEFDLLVEKTLRDWHIPGLAIAVVDGDKTYSKGYGIASFPDINVTADTLFYTGSTTKAFTAAALSFLVDDDQNFPETKWDTPVNKIIRDDFVLEDEWYTDHVTLEDAGSHRSGLPRHDLTYPSHDAQNATTQSIVRLLRYLPLTAGIRTKFQYCNLMFATLGHVIETLTLKPLGDVIHELIWGPLNMTSTTFSLSDAKESGKLAKGYIWVDSKTHPRYATEEYINLMAIAGAGQTISNVKDYAKWIHSLIHRLPPLSKAQHSAIMSARSIVPEDPLMTQILGPLPYIGDSTYSLGWDHNVYRNAIITGHDGGLPGFGAAVRFIPSKNWGVVMLGNTAGTSNDAETILSFALIDDVLGVPLEERFNWSKRFEVAQSIRKVLLGEVEKYLFPDVPFPPLAHSVPFEGYTGTYSHPAYSTVNVSVRSFVTPDPYYLRQDPSPRQFDSYLVKYLHVVPGYRPWNFTAELYHVTGDYFMMDAVQPWPRDANITADDGLNEEGEVTGKGAARFKIGPDGKVESVGILLEASMIEMVVEDGKKVLSDEAMIWFDKIV